MPTKCKLRHPIIFKMLFVWRNFVVKQFQFRFVPIRLPIRTSVQTWESFAFPQTQPERRSPIGQTTPRRHLHTIPSCKFCNNTSNLKTFFQFNLNLRGYSLVDQEVKYLLARVDVVRWFHRPLCATVFTHCTSICRFKLSGQAQCIDPSNSKEGNRNVSAKKPRKTSTFV